MTRYIQRSDGRLAGSIGAGKTSVPTSSDVPADTPALTPAQEGYRNARVARAAAAGRQLVFGPNVKACRRQTGAQPFVAVTYVLAHGSGADAVAARLRAAGLRVVETSGYATGHYSANAWTVEQSPSGEVEVVSPLLATTGEGWDTARGVERRIRGTFLRPGARITLVEAEAGDPDPRSEPSPAGEQ